MPVTIRPYRDPDLAGIQKLILPIQQDEFGIPITWEEQTDLHNIPAIYNQGAGGFWVAILGERIIGTIALIDLGRGIGALRKMFVHEDFRGGETRVASALLKTLAGHASRSAFDFIYLGTTAKFLAAHRFYEKSGFTEVSEDRLPLGFPRMVQDTKFYRLDLEKSP